MHIMMLAIFKFFAEASFSYTLWAKINSQIMCRLMRCIFKHQNIQCGFITYSNSADITLKNVFQVCTRDFKSIKIYYKIV